MLAFALYSAESFGGNFDVERDEYSALANKVFFVFSDLVGLLLSL